MNYRFYVNGQKVEKITPEIKAKLTQRFVDAIPGATIIKSSEEAKTGTNNT